MQPLLNRVRGLLLALWELRRSPRRVVRVAWWSAALCLAGLVLAPQVVGPLLFSVWMAANVALACTAVVWGLFHLRQPLRGRTVAFRWAFWLTVLGTLLLSSSLESLGAVTEATGLPPVPASKLLLLLVLAVVPVLFLLLLTLGGIGACIGAFVGRRWMGKENPARTGAGAWWTLLLFLLLATVRLPLTFTFRASNAAPLAVLTLVSGLPLFTAGACIAIHRFAYDPQQAAWRLVRQIGRRLVVRRMRRGRVRMLDLRGAALGLVAGLFALIAAANLLVPLKAAALVALIQTRNAALWTDENADRTGVAQRERIVLLEMDSSARHLAFTSRSEAAIQAEMLRKLRAWGALRIVLPLPAFGVSETAEHLAPHNEPRLTMQDVQRTREDLPKLTAAMRQAGNVVLAVPEERLAIAHRKEGPVGELMQAADAVGQADLATYTTRLPALSTQPGEFLPVPILLFAAALGRKPTLRPVPGHPSRVEIAGVQAPQVRPGTVLVDFRGAEPGRDFAHIAYGSVLREEPLYVGPADGKAGLWLPPQAYFRHKIVFLDSLTRRLRETPLGPIPRAETLAHAAAALLSSAFIAQPNLFVAVLGTLLFGAWVGHRCVGRDPLDAGWRTVIPIFFVFLLAILAFLSGTWIDPVAPITAILGAYLLVTQFTFTLERTERDWLRRFLAPEAVEEVLATADDRLGLQGKRQMVCVLFADARGFTPFAEQHKPDDVVYVINKYMNALTDVLTAHGGILDKYTGDGLMAIFRVGDSPREDVRRAVCAALAMRDAAACVTEELQAEGRQPLQIGLGLHYGEAIVGLVGGETQVNYTALGLAVVVGHRLQSIAAGGEVVISETVYAATSGDFRVEQRDPVQVKGISAPVRPYHVLDFTPAP